MSKFIIEYEIESISQNEANLSAHEILFIAGLDVHSVKVYPRPTSQVPKPASSPKGGYRSNQSTGVDDLVESFDEY